MPNRNHNHYDYGPIPTRNNGINYRSRQEAKMAVFMETFDWDFEYEPEGIEGDVRYLPDFLLHDVTLVDPHCQFSRTTSNVFVEVKSEVFSEDVKSKIKEARSVNIPIYVTGRFPKGDNEREILNDWRHIATTTRYGWHFYGIDEMLICNATNEQRRKEGCHSQLFNNMYCPICQMHYTNMIWVGDNGEPIIAPWHTHTGRGDGNIFNTMKALEHARNAKFEYGEDGYNPELWMEELSMKKLSGYQEAQLYTEKKILPIGGYVLKILDVNYVSYDWGDQIVLSFDIAEGDQKDFYTYNFRAQNPETRKWKGTYRLRVPKDDGSEQDNWSMRTFKTAITSVEESNPGYHWNWDENTLKGKLVGGVFNNKEYQLDDGRTGFFTNCHHLLPVDNVRNGNYKIPADTLLKNPKTVVTASQDEFMNIPDGDDDIVFPF